MEAESANRPVVLTCAQPSNRLTIGNYFGALRNWVTYLDTHDCFIGIVDMHAITQHYTPAELRKSTLDCLAQYIACGIDPEKAHLFLQSWVIGHSEMAWILGCLTSIGQLERMTQFKDKSRKQDIIGAGLLYYPVLQAADILLYNADVVPVGEDQRQHLELTRDIAQRFNHIYGETLKIPEVAIFKAGAKIMSLQNPENKMSKSDQNENGTLFLTDSSDILRKKIMSAVTDSDKYIRCGDDKPGVSNLLHLLSVSQGKSVEELEWYFEGKNYADLKKELADSIISLLEPIQNRYKELLGEKAYLMKVFENGTQVAQKRVNKMLSKVYKKVGFLQRGLKA